MNGDCRRLMTNNRLLDRCSAQKLKGFFASSVGNKVVTAPSLQTSLNRELCQWLTSASSPVEVEGNTQREGQNRRHRKSQEHSLVLRLSQLAFSHPRNSVREFLLGSLLVGLPQRPIKASTGACLATGTASVLSANGYCSVPRS